MKRFIHSHDRFEFGRVVTCVIHLLQENLSLFDQAMSAVPSLPANPQLSPRCSLSQLQLALFDWSAALEAMDLLCELSSVLRGGQLLNQLILLEENESSQRKRTLLRDVLKQAATQYFQLMQEYLYRGNIRDFYQVAFVRAFQLGVHGRSSTGVVRAFRTAFGVRTESHARTLRHCRK